MNETKKAKRTLRKLAHEHTHRGVLHPKDAEIDLLPHQEEFLEKRGIIEKKGGAAPSS